MSRYLIHPLFFPIIGIGLMIGILGFGIHRWYEIDSAVDFNILNEQFATNQTFVDSLECDDIIMSLNSLRLLISPTQQDEVSELRTNFENIAEEKGCKV